MTNPLKTILLILISGISYTQDFEGIIKYEYNYQPKTNEFSAEFLKKELGGNVISYVKNGFLKQISESEFMSLELYRYKDSKVYFMNGTETDTLRFMDIKKKENISYKHEIVKNADTILNIVCDKLIYIDKYGKKEYYYSSKLSLNPKYYTNFNYSNQNEILKLTKAVSLKVVSNYNMFVVEKIAVDIKKVRLEDDTFNLPKHSVLKQE